MTYDKTKYFEITDDAKTPTSVLLQRCKDKFPVYSYWNDEELDKEFPAPKITTTRYFKKSVEPDLLGKSHHDIEKKGVANISFRERILMELQYFEETGRHLDIQGWTITSSRTSGGKVARADWDDEFDACWLYAGDRGLDAGGRGAVSLTPDTSIHNTSDVVKKLDDFIEALKELRKVL
jgi:hypothetical protein